MQNQNIIIKWFFIVLSAGLFLTCSDSTSPDDALSDENFEFVLYDNLTSDQIEDIAEQLDENFQRIINDLRVQNMPRITIRIWADYEHFLQDMDRDIGMRYTCATGYIFGMTEFRIYYNSQVALAAVHEFAHMVSMQVNSSISNNPRWLWEAVALYESNDFINPGTLPYMVSGDYPTLSELNTDYNSSNHQIYSVGYVLLEYIIQNWGMDEVIDLIKTNGNLQSVLGISVSEFEYGWYRFIEEKYLDN